MTYWQGLRVVSALVLVAIFLFVLLMAARREPASPSEPGTNVNFGF